ncbi:S24 family peptidase [Pantoea allii]|uniref:Chromophore lyase n=1 Tax=Pantoea allii TaxID=574096 RepID=A0A2V2B482_9GAMM|nr:MULTISPECIES: S24 family peptidase [Pantoea]MBW1213903.1 chromophore lyase [Pantoea allii]MBW1253379.1 chromophore lyase [Pantoea allii]MBW1259716.1 chromophore lyase [Pantoea allii]MBW1262525.1 chromophore lyase [Pantoea allii]MBW1268889.1 chromophore lyase [Pantoea allii]
MVKKESTRQAFTARLIAACESAGITGHGRNKQVACALQRQGCKISAPGVWKWFNAQSVPDNGNLLALSQLLGVRVEWLQYGMDQHPEPYPLHDVPCQKNTFRVNSFDLGQKSGAGLPVGDDFVETIQAIEYGQDEARVLFSGRPADHIRLIAINSDAMSDTFAPRDQLFVDISVQQFDGDGIYIFTLDEQLYLKRLQLQHKRIAVISDNKRYETWYLDRNEAGNLNVLAKVIMSQAGQYHILG